MNYGSETKKKVNYSGAVAKARLMVGLGMLFAGLYLGFFSAGAGVGFGFLSVMASPFVMIAER